ncbi:MAG: DUF3459 domain-containing protein, partial [Actinoplanes sp.]
GLKEERAGGDDEIRPAFPEKPDDLFPYGWETYRRHQQLIAVRRRHPWLTRARTRPAHLTNAATALVSTAPDDPGRRIVTLLNTGDTAVTFPVDLTGLSVLAGDTTTPGTVPAHGWSIMG